MPVFQETSNEARDFRILPSIELPLPRITPRPAPQGQGDIEKYEVVVIGVSQAKSRTPHMDSHVNNYYRQVLLD